MNMYGNTGSAPLIGSKVIRASASDGSTWSEKGSRNRFIRLVQQPKPCSVKDVYKTLTICA